MAVPKKKVSRSRRNMRRFASGNKMVIPTGVPCASCGDLHRPHRICRCGSYNNRVVTGQTASPAAPAPTPSA